MTYKDFKECRTARNFEESDEQCRKEYEATLKFCFAFDIPHEEKSAERVEQDLRDALDSVAKKAVEDADNLNVEDSVQLFHRRVRERLISRLGKNAN